MQGQQGRKLLLIELVVPPFFILLTVIIRMCAACYLLQLLHTDTCSRLAAIFSVEEMSITAWHFAFPGHLLIFAQSFCFS